MSRKKTYNDTLFNKVLANEHLRVSDLHAQCIKMGYIITKPNVYSTVNSTRNFTIKTMCKLIYALRALTGNYYTFNDCFEYCEFTDINSD